MASAPPGWCKHCHAELEHSERTNGRAREFCNATHRQAFHRAAALRRGLRREIGLTEQQVGRLIALYNISPRAKRDASTSRSEQKEQSQ